MNHSLHIYLKSLIFSLLMMLGLASFTQEIKVSEQAQFSIMTLGPYQDELYSAFGHSAIRLTDPVSNVDWIYNYGVFDFNQENFYWNFAQGKMLYKLGMSRYKPFRDHYIEDDRYIIEQRLNLTQAENQRLADFLSNNYKPENKDYLYNYVYENCATKMRAVLDSVFPGQITYDLSYIQKDKTIRDLMDDYLDNQPWGDWIIDIGLGQQIDKVASPEEYMFLPDYVNLALAKATITKDSTTVPLVSERVQVHISNGAEEENSMLTPFNFFVIMFFVVGFITNRDFKKNKRTKWIDPIVFTVAGLIGWWVVFLWFGTEHLSKDNLNILWAIPLHIPFAYMLGIKKFQKFLSYYFLVVSGWYLVLLVIYSALPQPLHMAMIPLILTMVLRGFYIHFDLRKQLKKSS
ncbi:MAG: hypothetical protein ACI83W_000193 [Marinoscillum sp.]|jgi:hypothetical protein